MINNITIGKLIFKTEKARERFIKRYTEMISRHGYTPSDIEKETEILTNKFQKEASFSDAIWSLFNGKVLEVAQEIPPNFEELKHLYFNMSVFLAESEEDPKFTLEEAQKYRLMYLLNNTNLSKVRVSCTSFGCEPCKELNEKVFSIKEALQNKILPNKNCKSTRFKYPWCTCHFVAVPN